jgi:hypothetical protein
LAAGIVPKKASAPAGPSPDPLPRKPRRRAEQAVDPLFGEFLDGAPPLALDVCASSVRRRYIHGGWQAVTNRSSKPKNDAARRKAGPHGR